MKMRSVGLKFLGVAFATGALLSAATVTPVQAQPDRCRAEAWVFCDPYWARTTPEWQACVADYIENCVISDPDPCGVYYPWCHIRTPKAPKASKASIVKMLEKHKTV